MDVHRPSTRARLPTVVLAHSVNGVKEDLTQFAFALAGHGVRVCNVDWRGGYPRGYRDLAAAVRYTRDRADGARVMLVAWSDGGLVGAVVALDPHLREGGGADGFVGLGGYYGWPGSTPPSDIVTDRTVRFFGTHPDLDPAPWRAGNPHSHLTGASGIPVTLIVGDQDPLLGAARSFADALAATRRGVSVVVVPHCQHTDLVLPRMPSGRRAIRSVLVAAGSAGGAAS